MSETAERHGGPIDPFSEYSLRDFVTGDLPEPDMGMESAAVFEYCGFHIIYLGDGKSQVLYDGHAGIVKRFHADEYDDVLELVDDLNTLVLRRHEFDYQDDKEALVEWAGKIMTSDNERAESEPEHYIHIPDEPIAWREDDDSE